MGSDVDNLDVVAGQQCCYVRVDVTIRVVLITAFLRPADVEISERADIKPSVSVRSQVMLRDAAAADETDTRVVRRGRRRTVRQGRTRQWLRELFDGHLLPLLQLGGHF